MLLPLDPRGDDLGHPRAMPEVVTQLVMGGAEVGRRVEGARPAHGAVAPLGTPVVLFNTVVQVLAAAMGIPSSSVSRMMDG